MTNESGAVPVQYESPFINEAKFSEPTPQGDNTDNKGGVDDGRTNQSMSIPIGQHPKNMETEFRVVKSTTPMHTVQEDPDLSFLLYI